MRESELMQAISYLREHLGLTQAQLALKLGKSYASIQRYEQVKPPPADVLVQLMDIAISAGRQDLAGRFREAILAGLSPEVRRAISTSTSTHTQPPPPQETHNASAERGLLPPYLRDTLTGGQRQWHEKLAYILSAGEADAEEAVTRNIDVFYAYCRLRRGDVGDDDIQDLEVEVELESEGTGHAGSQAEDADTHEGGHRKTGRGLRKRGRKSA
jgi:transcriptional regulator with XRE-family HTH domain